MSGMEMGALGPAVLLLWSGLVFVVGRAFYPDGLTEPGPEEGRILP